MADEAGRVDGNTHPVLMGVVTGTTDIRMLRVDNSGNLLTGGSTSSAAPAVQTSSSAALTTVTATSSASVLIAANTARRGLIISGSTAFPVFVAYSTLVSVSSNYTVLIPANAYWEMPSPVFTQGMGIVTSSGSATVQVTELS